MNKRSVKYFCYMALSSTMLSSIVYADEDRTTMLEEITVTATKQAKNLQDVGMSISALGDEALTMMGAQGFEDFATSIPNLSFGFGGGGDGRNARSFAIRGISGSRTTGFYINETPIPNRVDPRLVDVKRVEVLRGPQGTLYGASSMGGTVRIITNKPDSTQVEGLIDATLSDTKNGGWNYKLEGLVNIPLVEDKVALRVIGYLEDEDGVFDRVFPDPDNPGTMKRIENVDDKRIKGIQAVLGFTPNENLEIITKASFQDTKSNGASWSSELGNFDQIKQADIPETLDEDWIHLALTANYSQPWGDFTFVATYFKQDFFENEGFTDQIEFLFGDGFVFPSEINQTVDPEIWTQEVRFASSLDGPVNFIIGGFHNKVDLDQLSVSLPIGFDAAFADYLGAPPGTEIFGTDLIFQGASNLKVKELAIFGEVYFNVTDDLKLTVGGRWFDVEINVFSKNEGIAADVDGAITEGITSEQGFNPKVLAEYTVNDDILIYATAAKGYRLGGISSFIPDFCGADLAAPSSSFDSDSLWNYEIGAKTSFVDNSVQLNGAIYHIDWKDIQIGESFTCGFGRTINGGSARSRGFELELSAILMEGMLVSGGLGYADAKFTSHVPGTVPVVGDRLLQVPKWTANVTLDYRFDVGFADEGYIVLNYTYTGNSLAKFSNDPTFSTASALRGSYNLVHGRIGVEMGQWDVSVFVQNLFDVQANLSEIVSLAAEIPGLERFASNRPRTVGLQVRLKM